MPVGRTEISLQSAKDLVQELNTETRLAPAKTEKQVPGHGALSQIYT
jgi:hypothetical protein